MILGRNTQQWMALIVSTLGFVQLVIGVAAPELAATSAVILGGLGGLLGVYIAFVANTLTTPINDPQLVDGTVVRITDANGRMIAHQAIDSDPARPNRFGPKPATPQVHSTSQRRPRS